MTHRELRRRVRRLERDAQWIGRAGVVEIIYRKVPIPGDPNPTPPDRIAAVFPFIERRRTTSITQKERENTA